MVGTAQVRLCPPYDQLFSTHTFNPHPEEPLSCAASRRIATSACGPSFEARREERRAPQDDGGVLMRQNLGQEFLRPVAARRAEKLVLGGILDDFALIHENHPMRDLAGEAH